MIDADTADDLMSSFDEHYDELQAALNKLNHHPDDKELINLIFRSMHTIKGNAAMVQIQPLVDVSHGMEETIDAIRDGHFITTEKLCDLLLTGTDRLRDLHKHYLFDKPYENIAESLIIEGFDTIARCRTSEEIEQRTHWLYHIFYPETEVINASDGAVTTIDDHFSQATIADHASYLDGSDSEMSDLEVFRGLSLQTDAQNIFWDKRTDNLVYMAMKLCQLSTTVEINKTQLVAAIYMHDIGMAFVAHDIVNKQAKLNPMELKKLKVHVVWSYQLLSRMPGWEDAAAMVLQHHEQEDGSGYPQGLHSDNINEGAKILAIIDAFYAMTNLRSDRSYRRSVLRAISEINACSGSQFNRYWVDLFNQVVRSEVKKGST